MTSKIFYDAPPKQQVFTKLHPGEGLAMEVLFYLAFQPSKGQRYWLTYKEIGKILSRHPDTVKRYLNSVGLFRLPPRLDRRGKRKLSPLFDDQTSPQARPAHYDR